VLTIVADARVGSASSAVTMATSSQRRLGDFGRRIQDPKQDLRGSINILRDPFANGLPGA